LALLERAAILFQQPPRSTPDGWARRNRVYPRAAAIPGPRDPFLTPYVVPVGRAVASCAARRIVLVTAAQSGKTDLALDCIS
jgi:phage terminase large subunit GpA-like protein